MQQNASFPKVMKGTAIAAFAVTVVCALIYHFFPLDWLLSVAISAGTTFYHFAMRLTVGGIVPRVISQPLQHPWFRQKTFEPKLYEVLRVKHWKDHMPTYDPASFSLRTNTLEQIVHNCCVSEAVHEVIIGFSFIPLAFTIWWGAFPVFLITSVLAATFDCCFVILQRYNRPRLIRILEKKEALGRE